MAATNFPPLRACIFDVDGTLINSEDIYTDIYNEILHSYGKPAYPWAIKATQQSRGTPGTQRLLAWAQLPLSVADWKAKEKAYTHLFKNSKILPGVETLLTTLSTQTSPPVKLALASSAGHALFDLKTSHIPAISAAFHNPALHVFGDDPEMAGCEKKPNPDIFLLTLRRLNEATVKEGEAELRAEECLVFEDSIAGVEAARRAGMRVVWVPHPGLAEACAGKEMDVLMGRTEDDGKVPEFLGGVVGKLEAYESDRVLSEDGRAEMVMSLEGFRYTSYEFSLKIDVQEGGDVGIASKSGLTSS
ncbi:haloacid dehalogenase-like hydrolase [Massariosphaeria phaeospora]|uniref:Haloacid dehalogenase-like hydrolase n=1 Tax=Massariosphaeria phaeospora TaxID=100035 RepID=A0A7C8MCC1_9PLEO|nr:haloacid dehalogenase-like hydrolase [Massariosphaeria phaeospora]